MRLHDSPRIGDAIKSWDVLTTIEYLETHVSKDAPILDIGAYASELLIALHRLGYRRLCGVDVNPQLLESAHADEIQYTVADFKRTPYADSSFAAITAISVIEHGFEAAALLAETARLLRPGGYFIASFDYWPNKIDTSGTKFFGMDWLIFSEREILSFMRDAQAHGLEPIGEVNGNASERPVKCAGKAYTFGWLVLRRSSG
ncbi:MAG TPA: class I SAM-dependent methyltransferase [Steroidobacteraceae bacterium]|nr:class I SAM-dependent methyltransferase [Steroidobacteraceae bacterium]